MKMIVEVNVFVMPRHFNQFSGLTGLVVEYVNYTINIKDSKKILNMPIYNLLSVS
jgi:hypothetical protein